MSNQQPIAKPSRKEGLFCPHCDYELDPSEMVRGVDYCECGSWFYVFGSPVDEVNGHFEYIKHKEKL